MDICDCFPALSPFDIRKQRFSEVFLLIRRMNNMNDKKEKSTHCKKVKGKTRCYVPVKE